MFRSLGCGRDAVLGLRPRPHQRSVPSRRVWLSDVRSGTRGDTMNEPMHLLELVEDTYFPGWFAACSCGWESQSFDWMEQAADEGAVHQEETA